jgi:hypothetical protein
LSGAQRRAAEKELTAIDRRLGKLAAQLSAVDVKLAEAHDDYDRLLTLQTERDGISAEVIQLEDRWLELGEAVG